MGKLVITLYHPCNHPGFCGMTSRVIMTQSLSDVKHNENIGWISVEIPGMPNEIPGVGDYLISIISISVTGRHPSHHLFPVSSLNVRAKFSMVYLFLDMFYYMTLTLVVIWHCNATKALMTSNLSFCFVSDLLKTDKHWENIDNKYP